MENFIGTVCGVLILMGLIGLDRIVYKKVTGKYPKSRFGELITFLKLKIGNKNKS